MTSSPSFVILGATGGIGSDLCRRLAASGARLILGGRDEGRLNALAEATGGHAHVLDATVPGAVDACFDRALELHGRIDGAANCIGSLLLKSAHLTTDADWDTTLATNLTTAFAAVRAGAKAIRTTGVTIVLVSSSAARPSRRRQRLCPLRE